MTDGAQAPATGTDEALHAEQVRVFLEGVFGKEDGFACDRIGGGQSNPTYAVDFGARKLILREKPKGKTLPGAHAIDREYRVMKALETTDVPVPKAILYHDDPGALGTPFYLMERLDGRVFHDCALPSLSPDERRGMYRSMAEAMAKLHAVDPAAIGLADFGRPGNYFERQVARWSRQYRESPNGPPPELDRLSDWLTANLPGDDERVAIAHGDFRLGNMIFHPDRPEVVGILDWELATLGHPLADLGFCCLPWNTAPDEYGGILGLDRDALGIPSQAEFVAHYFAHAIPTAPLEPFHVVFALFRFSAIWVGIADRARAGSAASADTGNALPLARSFAKRALEIVDGERTF